MSPARQPNRNLWSAVIPDKIVIAYIAVIVTVTLAILVRVEVG